MSRLDNQPPLGGCVLKPVQQFAALGCKAPAAFRRLCVETANRVDIGGGHGPAAFRRLCVETCGIRRICPHTAQPPLGGCVLKLNEKD